MRDGIRMTERTEPGRLTRRGWWAAGGLLMVELVVLGASGCEQRTPASPATQPTTAEASDQIPASAPEVALPDAASAAAPPYPAGLNQKSKPAEVAAVFLKALVENDEATLRGLVAHRSAVAALRGLMRVQTVTGKEPTVHDAGRFTLDSWRHKLSRFFVKETLTIAKVEDGDQQSTAWIGGQHPDTGRPWTMVVHLVFEDWRWRVAPKLDVLDSPPPR